MSDVGLEFSETRSLDLLGYILQEGDGVMGKEMLGAVDKLCIRSSDVADIGILGQIDVPEWEDGSKTINLTGAREIKYFLSKPSPDYDRAELLYNTYCHTRDIFERFILSAVRAMLWEHHRWTSKGGESGRLNELFDGLIKETEGAKTSGDILKDFPVEEAIEKLSDIFSGHASEWTSICKAVGELREAMVVSDKSLSFRSMLVRLVLLQNEIHVGGGSVLELMLKPGEKHLGNELLLRFRAESEELVDQSMFRYGSSEAKKLLNQDRRQKGLPLWRPRIMNLEQEQLALADSLLNDEVLSERSDRIAKSLVRYPIFGVVFREVFGGHISPADELIFLAKLYLKAAVERGTSDSSVIVVELSKREDGAVLNFCSPEFFGPLNVEAKNGMVKIAAKDLESKDWETKRRAAVFLDISGVIGDKDVLEEVWGMVKKSATHILSAKGENGYEAEVAQRILEP